MYNFQGLIDKVYKETRHINTGKRAHYIPQLAKVDPRIFGISICTVGGDVYNVGDYKKKVAIESISKLFTLAAVTAKHGTKYVAKRIGSHGSWAPFNSVTAANRSHTHTINPFLNQGAMATTSLLYQKNQKKYKKFLLDNMSTYAASPLKVGKSVYHSESATNSHNMSLAYLLKSFNRFYGPVIPSVDAYTYQCSVMVNSMDLAKMASTFANQGVQPISKKKLLTKKDTQYILNILQPEGLYQYSDRWMALTGGGAYAKSGVGGGILIVIPGICGIGIVSPRLDRVGNSKRGIAAGIKLSRALSKIGVRVGFFTRRVCKTNKNKKKKKTKTRKRKYR